MSESNYTMFCSTLEVPILRATYPGTCPSDDNSKQRLHLFLPCVGAVEYIEI
jgi:hypothetical protein